MAKDGLAVYAPTARGGRFPKVNMARLRTPTAVLEQKGAFQHDPARARARENEPIPSGPLGDPPDTFNAEQLRAWKETVAIVPPGVLTNADRHLVEKYARLRARESAGEAMKAAEHNLMMKIMTHFGMTPSARAQMSVAQAPKKPTNRFAEMAQGNNVQ